MIYKKHDVILYFEGLLKNLQTLNSNCVEPIILSEEFEEQHDNLKDMKKLLEDFSIVLEKLDEVDRNDTGGVDSVLAEYHRILTTLEWHISELSEINLKMFKKYSSTTLKEA